MVVRTLKSSFLTVTIVYLKMMNNFALLREMSYFAWSLADISRD